MTTTIFKNFCIYCFRPPIIYRYETAESERKKKTRNKMATRKLFDATTRYLTTTHDEDNTSSKSILNSNKIDLKLLKTAQIREANSSKLEINKRFLNSTMVNTLQGNRYKDSNNMYRAKKRKEELEEKLVGLDGTMKTPGTNKRLRDDSAEERYASS